MLLQCHVLVLLRADLFYLLFWILAVYLVKIAPFAQYLIITLHSTSGLFMRPNTLTESESFLRSSDLLLTGSPCLWKQNTSSFWWGSSFHFTRWELSVLIWLRLQYFVCRCDVCPFIMLSWRTAWFSSWRRTPPSPSRSSKAFSSSGQKLVHKKKWCFLVK